MSRLLKVASIATAIAVLGPASATAQTDPRELCGKRALTEGPDTIIVRGLVRTTAERVIGVTGMSKGKKITAENLKDAVQAIYNTGDYEDGVKSTCEWLSSERAAIVFDVQERPLLKDISVRGVKTLAQRTVEERVELLINRPVDPMLVAKAIARIDSLYDAAGYTLAVVHPDTTVVDSTRINLVFRVEEGRRMAISGLQVKGNSAVPASDIADAMKTKSEGFWWFRRGEFDDEKYAGDLGERIPALYARKGYLDFQLLHDTISVDRERGKGVVSLEVREGERYQIGSFSSRGNSHFNNDRIKQFYPFTDDGLSITQRAMNKLRGRKVDPTVFDNARWEDAVRSIMSAYRNEGYIYAQINPVLERSRRSDSTPVINMRLDINEQSPAIINRVDIIGNDYTVEHCIRDMIQLIPGGVYNEQALISSYQAIMNLGFFESPLPEPQTTQANEKGDINITFNVKEKRTGQINFGASMGQGTGIGGFIGLEQPNLFGRCKRGSLNWQFGRYLNDFNLAYTDPAIKLSRYSGTINAYRAQARYQIADLGQTTRTGGTLRIGMPVRGSNFLRAFVSYTGERVKYGSGGLLGTVNDCRNCFRSALGVDLTKDTRFGLPFAISGSLQSVTAEFNGGPLGGSANFQRYKTEYRAYAPLKYFGGTKMGSQPMILAVGLSARAGAVFGNTGPFFFSQRFALGGVQFGEPLRGYPEFSITPNGFLTGTSTYNAQRESFGSSFFATTMEIGLRFNAQIYTNVFYDAGNVWQTPREFDPTRLFRGAGFGLSTVTPLGPLGLDWAYGFDRLDAAGRRAPKWQLHFKLGQLF